MEPDDYLNPTNRDEHIARFVSQGLHALASHSGMAVTCEGEMLTLDFSAEIYALQRALELLGVDTSQAIHFSQPDKPPPGEC